MFGVLFVDLVFILVLVLSLVVFLLVELVFMFMFMLLFESQLSRERYTVNVRKKRFE